MSQTQFRDWYCRYSSRAGTGREAAGASAVLRVWKLDSCCGLLAHRSCRRSLQSRGHVHATAPVPQPPSPQSPSVTLLRVWSPLKHLLCTLVLVHVLSRLKYLLCTLTVVSSEHLGSNNFRGSFSDGAAMSGSLDGTQSLRDGTFCAQRVNTC